MRMLTYTLTFSFLCMSATAQHITDANDSSALDSKYLLESSNDTVWYNFQGEVGSFTLSAIDSISHFRLPKNDTLMLYSGKDTLIIITQLAVPVVRMKYEKYDRIAHVEFPLSITGNLREYSVFGNAVPTNMPPFIYSPTTDSGLMKLRSLYALDSVRREKGEVDRIVSLMKWAHRSVKHDGSVNPLNLKDRNALTILDSCRATNRGVNCRMIATLLNEVYLAMGFGSRHITCLPKDPKDPDCHVINIVYSDSLKKWLYMDPTFQAYFMDSVGQLLSIEDVRQLMASGHQLFVNDDIDYNGQPHDKQIYYRYMSKNLFRFSCPVSSEFNYESKLGLREWVYLNPIGYADDMAGTADTTWTEHKETVKFIDYYTNDNRVFWAPPH